MIGGVLCPLGRRPAIADGHHQRAIPQEEDARAVVTPRGGVGVGLEELLQIDQPGTVKPGPRQGGDGLLPPRLGVGEVDPAILLEPGVRHHVEEPPLVLHMHLGKAGDLGGPTALDELQPARTLRHEHAVLAEEGDRPRMLQPVGHLHEAEGLVFRADLLLHDLLRGHVRDGHGGEKRRCGRDERGSNQWCRHASSLFEVVCTRSGAHRGSEPSTYITEVNGAARNGRRERQEGDARRYAEMGAGRSRMETTPASALTSSRTVSGRSRVASAGPGSLAGVKW
jgi:hypothetical protein